MKSFALLSLVACAFAQTNTCPNGIGSSQTSGGLTFCCPGMTTTDPTGTFCVLGCTVGYEPCFPFCTADGSSNSQTTSGVCTSVPVTASNYSQLVGLATGSSAAPTSSPSTQTTTTSAAGAAQTGSTATTPTSSSSTKNAGAMMTAAPLLILGAIAGAVVV